MVLGVYRAGLRNLKSLILNRDRGCNFLCVWLSWCEQQKLNSWFVVIGIINALTLFGLEIVKGH